MTDEKPRVIIIPPKPEFQQTTIRNVVSMELLPVQGQNMSLADIESRLVQLDEQFQSLLAEN